MRIIAPFFVDGIYYDYVVAVAGDGEELDGNYCATQPMLNMVDDHENAYEDYCYLCKSMTRGWQGIVWSET
jgi:hypothetical protein